MELFVKRYFPGRLKSYQLKVGDSRATITNSEPLRHFYTATPHEVELTGLALQVRFAIS